MMLSIASQLERIHVHAKALSAEAELKKAMHHHRGGRHPYSAAELLEMRGEKVLAYMRGQEETVTIKSLSQELCINYTTMKEVVDMLEGKRRIHVANKSTQGRKYYEVVQN